jgi:hypothetical protein
MFGCECTPIKTKNLVGHVCHLIFKVFIFYLLFYLLSFFFLSQHNSTLIIIEMSEVVVYEDTPFADYLQCKTSSDQTP